MILGTGTTIKANVNNEIPNELSNVNIYEMNDDEFINMVMSYVNNSDKSFEEIQKDLLDIGVVIEKKEDDASNRSVPSDVDHSVYVTKKALEVYYYITASVHCVPRGVSAESGGLDVISVEWDTNYASYYTTSVGSYTTYMDGSRRNSGIVLFNIDDSKLSYNQFTTATVKVKPKKSGWMDVASKYVHTYNVTNYTWSIGGTISYSSGGLGGSFTFNISGTPAQNSWQLYADNSAQITAN